jgi:hypothetical protein
MIRRYINAWKLARVYEKRGNNLRKIAIQKKLLASELIDVDTRRYLRVLQDSTRLFYDSSDLFYKSLDLYNSLTIFHLKIAAFAIFLNLVIQFVKRVFL